MHDYILIPNLSTSVKKKFKDWRKHVELMCKLQNSLKGTSSWTLLRTRSFISPYLVFFLSLPASLLLHLITWWPSPVSPLVTQTCCTCFLLFLFCLWCESFVRSSALLGSWSLLVSISVSAFCSPLFLLPWLVSLFTTISSHPISCLERLSLSARPKLSPEFGIHILGTIQHLSNHKLDQTSLPNRLRLLVS